MAYSEKLAERIRTVLPSSRPIDEKKMFGGLAFLRHGHMVCGIHKGGAMFRVGKPNEAAALAVPGAAPMMFTGKPMAGMIDLSDDATADDARRGAVMALALGFVRGLPPK